MSQISAGLSHPGQRQVRSRQRTKPANAREGQYRCSGGASPGWRISRIVARNGAGITPPPITNAGGGQTGSTTPPVESITSGGTGDGLACARTLGGAGSAVSSDGSAVSSD